MSVMVTPVDTFERAVLAAIAAIWNDVGRGSPPTFVDTVARRALMAALASYKRDGFILGQHSQEDIARLEQAVKVYHDSGPFTPTPPTTDCYGG
jgi:hypothetical protein